MFLLGSGKHLTYSFPITMGQPKQSTSIQAARLNESMHVTAREQDTAYNENVLAPQYSHRQYRCFRLPYSPSSYAMPFMYSDSFQDDNELCNILAAIQLSNRSPAPAITPSPGSPVSPSQEQSLTSNINPPTLATTPVSPTSIHVPSSPVSHKHERRPGPSVNPLALATAPVLPGPVQSPGTQQDNTIYNVYSGKRTGLRETWCVESAFVSAY